MVRIACPPAIGDALSGARLLWSLPAWLRRPMRPEQALPLLRRRFERRESDFVELIRRTVFERPSSPYRRLLGLTGCEYGDFERLARHEGVEGALRELFERGVYLTVDELKGRQPVVRGSASLRFRPELFRNAS